MAERVLVTGATGMIGSAVVRRLLSDGYVVRAYVRDVSKLPSLPGLEPVTGDMRDAGKLMEAVRGCDVVIHLAARKNDEPDSEAINVGGATNLIAACKATGVKRVINVSTQSVKLKNKGTYATTKAAADALFEKSGLPVTTVFPSVVYGSAEEGIFGSLLRFIKLPVVPVIGSGEPLFWPIQKDDLARGLEALMKNPAATGRAYDIGGPDAVSFNGLVDELLHRKGMRKMKLHIPSGIAMLIATATAGLKQPPITKSNVLGASEMIDFQADLFFRDAGFIPRSLKEGLDGLLGAQPHLEDAEAKALLKYAMHDPRWEPDAATVALYRRACEQHEINPLHHPDPAVLNSWKLGALDAVTRLLKPQSQIQRKLLIAAAIVECNPASAGRLLPRDRSLASLALTILGAGVSAAAKLAAGLLLSLNPAFLRRNA